MKYEPPTKQMGVETNQAFLFFAEIVTDITTRS